MTTRCGASRKRWRRGAKVTEAARRNGVAASVVFTWRRQARTVEKAGVCFTPVRIDAADPGSEDAKLLLEDDRRVRPVPALARLCPCCRPWWRFNAILSARR